MTRRMHALVAAICGVVLGSVAGPGFAQQSTPPSGKAEAPYAAESRAADPAAQIDQMMSQVYSPKGPGAAVIVVKDGKTILRKGYGLADIEMSIPVRPEMVFRIGSVTKQFTAAVIMMLTEEGQLSVNDPITKFLPDYPTQGKTITVEHLLTHTSGIVSYTGMAKWQPLRAKDMSVTEVIDLFKNEPMEFAPGEKWEYDNSGYFLLGAIIEKVTGKPYADVVKERIFVPAGMTHTFYGDTSPIIANRAHGYEYAKGQVVNASYISMTQPYAAGALVSSVDDLALWDAALSSGKLLKPETRDRMFANHALKNGKPTNYGYGWSLAAYEGRSVQEHGGGINGFLCDVIRVPDEHLYVALLTNESGGLRNPSLVAEKAAAIVIGKPLVPPPETKVDPAMLEPLPGVYEGPAGKYKIIRTAAGLSMLREGAAQPLALFAISPTVFAARQALLKVTFAKDAAGSVNAMQIDGWRIPETAKRTAEALFPAIAAVDPKVYDLYVGEYEAMPGFVLTVTKAGDRLMVQATAQPQFEVFPTSESEFFFKVVDAKITFVKDAAGKVTSLILHQGGRDLQAKKVR